MLSDKAKMYLDDLIKLAMDQDYQLNAIMLYNTYSELPEAEKTPDTLIAMQEYLAYNNVTILSDGVEPDSLENTEQIEDNIRPFDPSKIDIQMKPMSLTAIIRRLENDELNLNTEFQRKSGLWTDTKKSQLIESILLKIPLPAFYFDATNNDNWLIIDGLQRITAFNEFLVKKTLRLTGLEFFTDLNGKTFDELPRPFIRRIEEAEIVAYIVNKQTPQNVKYNIFKRINTGGLELTSQEIRHALYYGKSVKLLKELAESKAFLQATNWSIKTDRMLDQEFVLRYVAVCYYGIENYNGVPDNFLNGAMEYINSLNEDILADIRTKFEHTMQWAIRLLGNHAFRKMASDGRRRPINKAIFEIWSRTIYYLDEMQLVKLEQNKRMLCQLFIYLCEQTSFPDYVKGSDKYSFNRRIVMVDDIVKKVLEC